MAVTIEAAKDFFLQTLEHFRQEQDLINEIEKLRQQGNLKLRGLARNLKDLYFLTDQGLLYLSRVKGGNFGLRRASTQTVMRLRRDPGSIIDVRNDPRFCLFDDGKGQPDKGVEDDDGVDD